MLVRALLSERVILYILKKNCMLVRALLSGRVTLKKNCVLVRVLLFGGLTHVEKELRVGACSSFSESHSLYSQKELRPGAYSYFWGTDSCRKRIACWGVPFFLGESLSIFSKRILFLLGNGSLILASN